MKVGAAHNQAVNPPKKVGLSGAHLLDVANPP
jgi:hypothetical protein